MVRHAVRGSAVWRELNSGMADWGIAEQMLAVVADTLRIANWQRSADGQKGKHFPEPLERPWDPPKRTGVFRPRPNDGKSTSFGAGAIPASDFAAFWNSRGAA